MMKLEASELSKREHYRLMTSIIIPRPIAFVTSLARLSGEKEGEEQYILNGAPFSYFSIISAEPPLLSISIGRRNAEMKDTARNILNSGEFVVHLVDEENIEQVNGTAASLLAHESEIEAVGMTPIKSSIVKVDGIKEANVRMECKLEKHLTFTEGETATDVIIGKIVCYHLNEEVHTDGVVDVFKLRPVARLEGAKYAKLGERFEIERPS